MNGWVGRVLRINLSNHTFSAEPLKEEWARDYLGGRGLGTRYYFEEVGPSVDPLSEGNNIYFVTGPLTGTLAASAGRFNVVAKSPLTGTIGAANSGGYFGPELKYAGWDMVVLEGRSPKPVYVYINNDQVEIRDAEGIWGLETHEATDKLLEQTDPEAKVAVIGPAGENLSLIANIINDKHRAPGRGGMGAVMGSKNLKALVVRGTKGVKVARPEEFLKAAVAAREKLAKHPVTGSGLPLYGTNVLVNILNQNGGLPTRNFRTGVFEGADRISGETQRESRLLKNKGCFGCGIGCGRVSFAESFGHHGEGPEYETSWSFGADCGVDDIDAVAMANYRCNELGLDTISMGATIACAMELYEMGLISREMAGVELNFGNGEALVPMVEAAAYRKGKLGELLAQGSFRLASHFGHPELSMTSKKQEMPAYDPRAIQGIGLNYATSNRGACHVRGYTISPEILGVPQKLDPQSIEEKPGWDKAFQDLTAVVDSVGMCLFTTFGIGAQEISEQLSSAVGIDYSTDDLMKIGERIWNMERLFNLKEGFSAADDVLPQRMTSEPLPEGPHKGKVSRVPEMLPKYYEVRGWTSEGVPTEEKIRELGLDWIR
ncbi:aldehyde:ferredoxin oxidoreductase [Thermanaerovibrio velox DSM 12556]|uniref:Aldehyde:ferredoxin oxidoreductase n=1 Tax=Thermanaerovibrio velox DSM 12556 TaxID=926567 RepID=H0UNN8_9BACT|nr:aldehyde:ferredoxin oxidoreductase [Thermanaerovibrio velox DSM 12556]